MKKKLYFLIITSLLQYSKLYSMSTDLQLQTGIHISNTMFLLTLFNATCQWSRTCPSGAVWGREVTRSLDTSSTDQTTLVPTRQANSLQAATTTSTVYYQSNIQ